jgi:DNA-directed RNA polymerase subunit RPC12/RpoP
MTEPLQQCDTCRREVPESETIRAETFGALDTERWQTLCCPHCGARLETVFVGQG